MSEAEITDAFDALFAALLVQRDAAAATAMFVTDDDALMSGSDVDEFAVGPEAIAALHRAIAGSPSRLRFQWRRRFVRSEDGVAWVNADGEILVEREGHPAATVPYRLTAVLIRRDARWRWHTFSGSQPHG